MCSNCSFKCHFHHHRPFLLFLQHHERFFQKLFCADFPVTKVKVKKFNINFILLDLHNEILYFQMDGLDPPILDETWGLEDFYNKTSGIQSIVFDALKVDENM